MGVSRQQETSNANMTSEHHSSRVRQCWGRTTGLGRCKKPLGTKAWYPFCYQHRKQPLKWVGLFGSAILGVLGLALGSYNICQGIRSSREVAQLRKDLNALKANSLLAGRLEKQYPLGYWLLAPHENQPVVCPSLDDMPLNIDWDNVRIEDHGDGAVAFLLPEVSRSQGGTLAFRHNRIILDAGVPSAAIVLDEMTIRVQRIDASHTGRFFVVGIQDEAESDTPD